MIVIFVATRWRRIDLDDGEREAYNTAFGGRSVDTGDNAVEHQSDVTLNVMHKKYVLAAATAEESKAWREAIEAHAAFAATDAGRAARAQVLGAREAVLSERMALQEEINRKREAERAAAAQAQMMAMYQMQQSMVGVCKHCGWKHTNKRMVDTTGKCERCAQERGEFFQGIANSLKGPQSQWPEHLR